MTLLAIIVLVNVVLSIKNYLSEMKIDPFNGWGSSTLGWLVALLQILKSFL